MKNEKKALIIGLVVGIIVALFYSHFFAPRYDIRKDGLSMMKIDKWTGQSWTLVNNNWKKMADMDENWEEVDKLLTEAMNIPFAQVDSDSALKKLRDAYPVLKDIPDDELLERIKLVYSKMVLVNMYLGEFVKASEQEAPQETAVTGE
jgi:hypothetical protein